VNLYMKRYDNYVVVVPLKKGLILVQKQFKSGVKRFCWGFPAGFINGSETSLSAAKRELLEETGLIATKLTKVGTFYDNVSKGSENFTIYLARNPKEDKKHLSNPDENESKIKNSWVNIKDLKKISMAGACMSLAKEIVLKG
jgi:ADP-ribose pyrophosphatase